MGTAALGGKFDFKFQRKVKRGDKKSTPWERRRRVKNKLKFWVT